MPGAPTQHVIYLFGLQAMRQCGCGKETWRPTPTPNPNPNPNQAMRQGGCGMEAWLLDPNKAKESLMLARASRLTLADGGLRQ